MKAYEDRGYFLKGDGRAPKNETVPTPQAGEVVVFYDFFAVGLRFPCDPLLIDILDRFNAQLHQLTPNAVVQLSKNFWVAKSFGSEADVDSFAPFYELHPQKCTKRLEENGPTLSFLFGICTFTS